MSTHRTIDPVRSLLSAGVGVALGAFTSVNAGEPENSASSGNAGSGTPDYADFSVPIASFFAAQQITDRLDLSSPPPAPHPAARAMGDKVSGNLVLSFEGGPRPFALGRWIPESRRERKRPKIEEGDRVAKIFYDAKWVLENVAEGIRFDRSYYADVELQETSYGVKFKEDPHDPRSVFSLKRVGVNVPLYRQGLTEVSLEFNVDKLYRAVRGDIPQLRGGLSVKF